MAPSRVMPLIKDRTSHHLLRDFLALRKTFWSQHLWALGYFAASSGDVTDEMLAKYIEEQDLEPEDDENFKVTELLTLQDGAWR